MPKPVMVIGGGIAGIQAATDLADNGIPVYLVESAPSIGGRMAQLDKTFPTNDCSACILAPKMSDCFNHENIRTCTYSEIEAVEGSIGNFHVKVKKKPRYIDEELCTGCGACIEKCPQKKVPDRFDQGLKYRKAIYKEFAQGIPNVVTIDPGQCLMLQKGKCGMCAKVCQAKAVRYDQKEEVFDLEVASIVFAPGFDVFDGNLKEEYGYNRFKNVVSSLDYERMMSASGPLGGHIARPSDNKEPERVAFLQCVGSRDYKCDAEYCSSVCCMYAIKEAIITKEHIKSVRELDIYYIDLRAFGKDFDKYHRLAEDKYGVAFKRSRAADIEEDRETGDLYIKSVAEDGSTQTSRYDLAVLSVGIKPRPEVTGLMKKLKVRVNKEGFIAAAELHPLNTSREGIYACGAATGPRDIPETVVQASAAAALAAGAAKKLDGEGFPRPEYVSQRDVVNEGVKVGVFVCHCGTNIGGIVNVPSVRDYSSKLPFVRHAEDVTYLCSADSQRLIIDRIREKGLNRVVVASCSPRTHEPLFRSALVRAGLNPYLLMMTNIRDQCSWVHMEQPEKATEKAMDLVKMAVAKALPARPLYRRKLEKSNAGVVIGGGAAGMTAARQLAELGFPVSIIEKESELGGHAAELAHTPDGRRAVGFVEKLKEDIGQNPAITVYKNSEIVEMEGYVGNYRLRLSHGEEITAGAVIIATGAGELRPGGFGCSPGENTISQLELERRIKEGSLGPMGSVYMIQCAGSREEGRQYCSRVCCTQAVKNAIYLKKKYGDINISILYRDMRTYGYYEKLYREARKLGVNFIRYEPGQKPVIGTESDKITVKFHEPLLDRELTDTADMVVLASAIVADRENNGRISRFLKVPLNGDGFFLEAHVKLRPVDFATEGVYVCGLAHGPKNLSESISQAKAAAARAAAVLSKEYLETEAMVAEVTAGYCAGCGTCEKLCAYKAITMNEKDKAEVNPVLCKGCGTCAAGCRSGAADLKGFSDRQIVREIEALFAEGGW